jgi:hypothetical protein
VVKRFLFNLPKSSDQHKSEETSPGEQSSQGNENGEKPAKSGNRFGEGIFVPVGNNKKVNLCDEKYIKYAEQSHITIKDTLVAACSGSSGIYIFLKIVKLNLLVLFKFCFSCQMAPEKLAKRGIEQANVISIQFKS